MWHPLRDALKKVVEYEEKPADAKAINDELNKIHYDCICNNDEQRINHMVYVLEEERIGTKKICTWFVKVLESEDMKKSFADKTFKVDDATRCKIIKDIQEMISKLDHGPISKK
jgi:hypothetical protein